MTRAVSDIRLKRVYDPPDEGDGMRVARGRLWPRGLSKEHAAVTLWLEEIALSGELRKWFGHDPARWMEFSCRYRIELAHNDEAVAKLASLVACDRVTLLYAARDTEHSHALVLADFLRDHRKGTHGHHPA